MDREEKILVRKALVKKIKLVFLSSKVNFKIMSRFLNAIKTLKDSPKRMLYKVSLYKGWVHTLK
jgi:hypothetical protein